MNQSPYRPPESDISIQTIANSNKGNSLSSIAGALICCYPIYVISVLVGLVQTYRVIIEYGITDTDMMLGGVKGAFTHFSSLIVISVIGFVLAMYSIFRQKVYSLWLYKTLYLAAIFTFMFFPFGTIFSVWSIFQLKKYESNYGI